LYSDGKAVGKNLDFWTEEGQGQIFSFLASYSLTKMPTGQNLVEHTVAK